MRFRRFWRKRKLYILAWLIWLCIYLLLPVFSYHTYGYEYGKPSLEFIMSYIIWPGAGTFLSGYFTWLARGEKAWFLLPLATILSIFLLNFIYRGLHILPMFLCLLFQGVGYGMIYFWMKNEQY